MLIYLIFILCSLTSWAKTIPLEAPIQEFRLPIFGDNGYKRWDIEGREGHFAGESSVMKIQGMRLRVYSGNADLGLEATLESLEATLWPKKRFAEGHEYLFLTTPEYTVVGYGWSWEEVGREDTRLDYKVILKSDVCITFKSALSF